MIDYLVDSWFNRSLKPRLFRMSASDPELAHEEVIRRLQRFQGHRWLTTALQWRNRITSNHLERNILGLRFPHPIGLAAGFDKHLVALRGLAALGFGFLEGGAITPLHQEGNPRPRIERDDKEQTLWNSLGFNNPGLEAARTNLLRQLPLPVPFGINLGKGKDTSLEKAIDDYRQLLEEFYIHAGYFTINISSPNTPGLRELQGGAYLENLVTEIMRIADALARQHRLPRRKSILFKLAPDMSDEELDAALDVITEHADGVIFANTRQEKRDGRVGGFSGPPIFDQALHMVSFASRHTQGRFPIIGCGGIDSVDRANKMLNAGAHLLQIFTALIFKGPTIPRRLAKGIQKSRIAT